MKRRIIAGSLLILVLFSILACSIFVGGPVYPTAQVPVSTGTALSLKDQISIAATQGAGSGTISLQITEAQLTDYLENYLSTQTDPLLTNPRVILQDGQMQVFGQVQQGMFTANVSITLQVSVDTDGLPKITITKTDFGPLPAPQGLNDAVSTLLQQAFTGSLGPVATGFRLDNITITDGLMTVSGRIK